MKTIITIGRQYGSGGRYLGKLLAERLNIPYYDKEILKIASEKSGICTEIFQEMDEKPNKSLLYSLVSNMRNPGDINNINVEMPLNHKIFLAQFDAIKHIAEEGSCVIVGRCADYVLRDNKNALKIFIYADEETRVKRITSYENIYEKEARDSIYKRDKERASYYNYFTGKKWGSPESYDLCINTSALDDESVVNSIVAIVKERKSKKEK